MELIKKINSIPIENFQAYLDEENLNKLHLLKLYLDDQYHNIGDSPISDQRYDMIKDTLKIRDPSYIVPVGAKLKEGENRVLLPFWLGSADKITPDNPDVLERWIKDNKSPEYVVSNKLDGISCLIVVNNNNYKLYTRGDGTIGADISYLSSYITTIPKNINTNIAIRGELIMKKKTFEKYKNEYRNPRNMVAGLVGAKTARPGIKDIDFVSYEIVSDTADKISNQLEKLKKIGFQVVPYQILKKIDMNILAKTYLEARNKSLYELDGLIVQSNVSYDRNTSGNPDYLFAFKMLVGDAIHESKVKHVEWNVSKWGQLKPVIVIEPLVLQDITINRATAHNAKYVVDNNLGPGAIVKITRSNEVIPYIVDVVKGAKVQMPNVEYTWDKNQVNIISLEYDNIMCIKLIAGFFDKLGIKHVSEATVKKMYENGLDNLFKIISASKNRLLQVPEFQERSAERIYTNIRTGLKNVNMSVVLGASGVFGFGVGKKRMEALFLDIPDLLKMHKTKNKQQIIQLVMKVEGFSNIMAEKIAENLMYADLFIQKLSKYATFKSEERVSNYLQGKKYVMTGFRDQELEEQIMQRGGKVTGTVSKNTNGVIVKTEADKNGKTTGKLSKALELGIPIYYKDEFIKNI